MFTKILLENFKEGDIFEKIILKYVYIRENLVRKNSICSAGEEQVPVTLLCEESAEFSGSVEQGIYLHTEQ